MTGPSVQQVQTKPEELISKELTRDDQRVWKHLIAGSSAAIASRTLTAPLDRLKTLAQASGNNFLLKTGIKMMIEEGGFWSMWRGNGTNLLKSIPEVTMRYVSFNEIKYKMVKDNPHDLSMTERLFAGGLSGVISHSIVHPLEVIKTRLVLSKTSDKRSLGHMFITGYKTDGFRFLFRGYATSLLGILIYSSIDFTTYESLKKKYRSTFGPSVLNEDVIFCGIIATTVGQVIAYPFAVVGVYLQTCKGIPKLKEVMKFVYLRGSLGMYSGLNLALLKGVPTFTTSYFVYELVLSKLHEQMI